MNRRDRLIENLQEFMNSADAGLNDTEHQILADALSDLRNNADVNRCIRDLKMKLSELALTKGLSSGLTQFFTELSRQEPSTSVSSMWNFMVRKQTAEGNSDNKKGEK